MRHPTKICREMVPGALGGALGQVRLHTPTRVSSRVASSQLVPSRLKARVTHTSGCHMLVTELLNAA
jgi:hypothetical protein